MEDTDPPPPGLGPRTAIGRVFGRVLAFMEKYDLWAEVVARVSPGTARLMAHPPGPLTWVPGVPFDEIHVALEEIGGDALTFKLGVEVARRLGGSVLAPVLRATLGMLGASPSTAFKAANGAYSLVSRGFSFHHEAWSATHGVILACFDGSDMPHATLIVFQGTLQWMLELNGVEGVVGPPHIRSKTPSATVAAYEVFLKG
jgi:hypothetical protein